MVACLSLLGGDSAGQRRGLRPRLRREDERAVEEEAASAAGESGLAGDESGYEDAGTVEFFHGAEDAIADEEVAAGVEGHAGDGVEASGKGADEGAGEPVEALDGLTCSDVEVGIRTEENGSGKAGGGGEIADKRAGGGVVDQEVIGVGRSGDPGA